MGLNRRRILLVQPLGYAAEAAGRDVARLANLMPPLGLASLAAYVEQHGFQADLLDGNAHLDADQRMATYLRNERPAFVGFSCTTSTFLDGLRMARLAKQVLPEVTTIFGGPHVSALKGTLLERFPEVDLLVVGEGEETLRDLMARGGEGLGAMKGLVYRDGAEGPSVFTGYREGLVLDDLPYPAYDKLPGFPEAYQLPIFNYPTTPNTSCISSRGCPYACTYCDRSVFQRTFRHNSADYLYAHLRFLKTRYGIRHVNFYDDQFTFHRGRVVALCERLLKEPLGLTFNCAVRADHIDRDLVRLMKRAGAWMMSLGIETGDPELLAQHRQKADLDLMAEQLRMIHAEGVRTKGLLMIGLPGETEASVRRSMDYVFGLPIDDFNLAKFTPFPGSPLYETIHEHGTFDEQWARMDCVNVQFVPHGLTVERLEQLFRAFYEGHFRRPKVLLGYVAMLWKSPHSWWRFLKGLKGFLAFTRVGTRNLEVKA